MGNLAPLSRAEEKATRAIATADPRLGRLIEGRNGPTLLRPIERDRHQPDAARQALIGLYDYEHDRTVVAVVDLDDKVVVTVEDSPVQLQLSANEAREAVRLAGKDPQVKEMLAGRKMDPLTRLYFPPWAKRHDPPHRYAIVFIRPNTSERIFAVVDLSQGQVVEVLHPAQLRAQ